MQTFGIPEASTVMMCHVTIPSFLFPLLRMNNLLCHSESASENPSLSLQITRTRK